MQLAISCGMPNREKNPATAVDYEGNNAEYGLNEHGTVADEQHIFFVGNRFGGRSRRYEAVETGNGAAGDGYE